MRIPYANGDLKARGPAEVLVDSLTSTPGAHTTRSLVFSKDGQHMLVAVGSATNVANTMTRRRRSLSPPGKPTHGLGAAWGDEDGRAMVVSFDPDGKNRQTYATGLRNCVGLTVYPTTAMSSVRPMNAMSWAIICRRTM